MEFGIAANFSQFTVEWQSDRKCVLENNDDEFLCSKIGDAETFQGVQVNIEPSLRGQSQFESPARTSIGCLGVGGEAPGRYHFIWRTGDRIEVLEIMKILNFRKLTVQYFTN